MHELVSLKNKELEGKLSDLKKKHTSEIVDLQQQHQVQLNDLYNRLSEDFAQQYTEQLEAQKAHYQKLTDEINL